MYLHPICSCSHWIVTLGGVGGRATRRESSSPASKLPSETSTGFPTTGCRAERLDSPKRLEMVWTEKPWYDGLQLTDSVFEIPWKLLRCCSLKTRSMLWKERVPGDCCWYPCHLISDFYLLFPDFIDARDVEHLVQMHQLWKVKSRKFSISIGSCRESSILWGPSWSSLWRFLYFN